MQGLAFFLLKFVVKRNAFIDAGKQVTALLCWPLEKQRNIFLTMLNSINKTLLVDR